VGQQNPANSFNGPIPGFIDFIQQSGQRDVTYAPGCRHIAENNQKTKKTP